MWAGFYEELDDESPEPRAAFLCLFVFVPVCFSYKHEAGHRPMCMRAFHNVEQHASPHAAISLFL
eukprot:scaffold59910_cov22-Tisochrysis_lutea.AAC.2